MSAPGSAGPPGRDREAHEYDVVSSRTSFEGKVFDIRTDVVRMPDGSQAQRDVVVHPGAVAVVALDDDEQVVLVEQYRHPVARRLWELPAGLLDVEGEPALDAARRELVEEAGLEAADWAVLVDVYNSPGGSDEAVRVYLARGLREVGRPDGEHEEAEMEVARVGLDEAVDRVLAGDIENSLCVAGVLAAAVARGQGWAALRAADAPWPAKPSVVRRD